MESNKLAQFVEFLRQDLAIPAQDVKLAIRYAEKNPGILPMILWQFGLVTLDQLNQIFDWLDKLG
jgi:hypothetical protein